MEKRVLPEISMAVMIVLQIGVACEAMSKYLTGLSPFLFDAFLPRFLTGLAEHALIPEMLHWIHPAYGGNNHLPGGLTDRSMTWLTASVYWQVGSSGNKSLHMQNFWGFCINARLQQARPKGGSRCLWRDETNHRWASLQPTGHSKNQPVDLGQTEMRKPGNNNAEPLTHHLTSLQTNPQMESKTSVLRYLPQQKIWLWKFRHSHIQKCVEG